MNLIYSKMKNLVPVRTCLKMREDNNFLIVADSKGNILYLNETSKEFYKLCNGILNIDEVLNKLLLIYDVTENELQDDIVILVRDMQWNDILSMKEI